MGAEENSSKVFEEDEGVDTFLKEQNRVATCADYQSDGRLQSVLISDVQLRDWWLNWISG